MWEFIDNPKKGGWLPHRSIRAPCACPSCHPGCNGCHSRFWVLLLFPTLPHLPSSHFSSPQADLRSKDDTLTLSPSKDLLSVRKPSVGRTHSLPNDSYMFQPPYSSPCPASLGNRKPAHHKSQSGTPLSAGTREGFSNGARVVVSHALQQEGENCHWFPVVCLDLWDGCQKTLHNVQRPSTIYNALFKITPFLRIFWQSDIGLAQHWLSPAWFPKVTVPTAWAPSVPPGPRGEIFPLIVPIQQYLLRSSVWVHLWKMGRRCL